MGVDVFILRVPAGEELSIDSKELSYYRNVKSLVDYFGNSGDSTVKLDKEICSRYLRSLLDYTGTSAKTFNLEDYTGDCLEQLIRDFTYFSDKFNYKEYDLYLIIRH